MSTFQHVLDATRTLTPAERLQLVAALWEEASPSDWPPPSEEWIREAQRRSAEFDQTKVASSWSEVRQRARGKVGLDE